MKYVLVVFCLLLLVFACQSDLSDDMANDAKDSSGDTYGKAVYGKSEYGRTK